ncbi:transposase IS4 family protein [Rippkaea orientalis PCC 8801]|uniref:Transposase IS4 family protein n=1 Tax=Rippkaea orientalis (strain PCC 8801 / RF-1) TaxID=41431 RepID=B7K5C0_RIPO1|nr:transposase family protein [Rippkaea orientalis]ACK67946.1 transposase IS4 family protein [Rippkaea orientalis PCC 8801]
MESYTWGHIHKYPKQTKRLLGIDYQQLEQLIALGKLLHQENKEKIEKTKIRINQPGSGTYSKLSEEEQIVLMLVYLRHNISFQILGLLFQVSESTAHNIFSYWQKLFEGELPPSLLEQVKKFQEEEEIIQEQLTDYELIVDSSEQPIERPSDCQEQKKYYSGKQQRHTLKNQFIVLPKAQDIIDVVMGKPGPMSDIKICRQTLSKFDVQQTFSGDKAYIGETQIKTPYKKPKKGELTESQKKENKALSSNRIFVEHLIRVVKVFKVVQERFRLQKSRYKSVLLTVCGLVRLRIGSLILRIIESEKSGEVIDVKMSHSFISKLDFVSLNPD